MSTDYHKIQKKITPLMLDFYLSVNHQKFYTRISIGDGNSWLEFEGFLDWVVTIMAGYRRDSRRLAGKAEHTVEWRR